jgi:cell division protease FtsH
MKDSSPKLIHVAIPISIVLFISGLFFFLTHKEDTSKKDTARKEKQTLATELGGKDGEMSYNSLWSAMGSKKLSSLKLDPHGKAELTFRDKSISSANFPPEAVQTLAERARKQGVIVSVSAIKGAGSSISWLRILIPFIIIGAIIAFFFMWKSYQEGKKVKKEKEKKPVVRETFRDVAGCPEAVEEVRELVLFLKEHEQFLKLGAKMPSGAILHGPPGTGKTLIARALAGEAGVPFYHMAGSEAVNKYVGVGASSIRDLFRKARKSERGAVIFIDEIDALGRKRSGDGEPSSREHDSTLNQLLVELDGFSGSERIIVIGATNRLDTLDAALLRPGRLSRHIPVLAPNEKGREEILEMYARNKPLADDVDLKGLAHITAGSTGADLSHILNEAAIQAARKGQKKISNADLKEGHLRTLAGPERVNHIQNEDELRAIAYHEAGHVLCGELCPEHEGATRVTIIARGGAAGMAVWGAEDKALHSPEYLRQRMIAILGGRAAEKVAIGNISSGAANDLQQANELARTAIEDWGISELTGQLLSRGHRVSDKTRALVDEEVEEMVALAFSDAVNLLEQNNEALDNLANELIKHKVLERVDILAAIQSSGKIKELSQSERPKSRQDEQEELVTMSQGSEKQRRIVRTLRRALVYIEEKLPAEKKKVSS